jgi:nitrile hydratase
MQRFRAGDSVRTRAANPEGHTRLPRYLCDRRGTIEALHGLYPLPDERALGVNVASCTKEMLYTVVFDGREVWREGTSEPVSISADLWDSYLEPEQAR